MVIPKVRQLPSGNWFVQIRMNGKSISKTFSTETEATLWAQTYKATFKNKEIKSQYDDLLLGIAKKQKATPIPEDKRLPTIAGELELVDKMDGVAFEKYCKNLLLLSGCFRGGTIRLTKAACDYGADLIIECLDGKRVSVQCKRLQDSVRIDAIQEVVASKQHYNTDVAAVITNSYFTKQAKLLATENGVALIDRKELTKLIQVKIDVLEEIYSSNQWEGFLNTLEIIKIRRKKDNNIS